MIITKLNIYMFDTPFISPIKTNLITLNTRKVLVIGAIIDGFEYFAEANSFETPWYHYETIDTVHQTVIQIFDRIKGKSFSSINEMQPFLDINHPNASSCFDVIAYQYFNSLKPVRIPLGQTLHHDDTLIHTNASRIKLKMHNHILQQVKSLREISDIQIVIDANGLLDSSHFKLLNCLSEHNILYFEQPFKSIMDYKLIHDLYPHINLAIDESATDVASIERFQDIGVETAVIKYSRIGGITKALQLTSYLPDMQFVAGGMYEFGLSKYYTALLGEHFQTVPDVTAKGTYFKCDFVDYDELLIGNKIQLSVPKVKPSHLNLIASFV
ncbi:enolase C-terminal domain-like protein [Macrococcus animalis]|uniref:enolase C-terminal domain-like protein n=1 Tax=Macrococcus animalis TaxID=3395467 RepID=UPI0039BDEBAD